MRRSGLHTTVGSEGSYAALSDNDTVDTPDRASPTPRASHDPAQRVAGGSLARVLAAAPRAPAKTASTCRCGAPATFTVYADVRARTGRRGHPATVARAALAVCEQHAAAFFDPLQHALGGIRP